MSSIPAGTLYEQRFRVERVVDDGLSASVYLARDEAAGRVVSLKVLRWDAGDAYSPALRARHERELRVIAGLRDPHTVRLFDYGESADGHLYLVFEHVAGETLRERLDARDGLDLGEAVRLLQHILSSLREAHHHGVMHRDLSPEHVRVESRADGLHAIVVDFGIARAVSAEHPSLTATGELVGTPRYMSPEQVLCQPLTPASDVYAAGLVGYEMLFGAGVLLGSDASEMLMRLQARPVREVVTDSTTAPVTRVLARMTEREPSQRIGTASAALAALDVALTQQPAVEQRPAPPRRPNAELPNRVAFGAAGVLLVAFVCVAAWALSADPPQEAGSPVTPAKRTANALVKGHQVVEPQPPAEPQPAAETPAEVELEPIVAAEGAIPSPGCTLKVPNPEAVRGLTHYVPPDYDHRRQYSVVMIVPGDYLVAHEALVGSKIRDYADEHHAIVIVPDDYGSLGVMTWREEEDVEIIRRAYSTVSESFCVDRARTFVLSHAAGSVAAVRLACEGWFTALVTNGYAPDITLSQCEVKVPRLVLYPLDSPHIKIGAKSCAGARHETPDQMAARWKRVNDCKGASVRSEDDGVTCSTFNCEAPFEICRVPGGTLWPPGHMAFPLHGLIRCDGDSEPRTDVTARAWEFFSKAPPLRAVP